MRISAVRAAAAAGRLKRDPVRGGGPVWAEICSAAPRGFLAAAVVVVAAGHGARPERGGLCGR
jgi:hypothetical protein